MYNFNQIIRVASSIVTWTSVNACNSQLGSKRQRQGLNTPGIPRHNQLSSPKAMLNNISDVNTRKHSCSALFCFQSWENVNTFLLLLLEDRRNLIHLQWAALAVFHQHPNQHKPIRLSRQELSHIPKCLQTLALLFYRNSSKTVNCEHKSCRAGTWSAAEDSCSLYNPSKPLMQHFPASNRLALSHLESLRLRELPGADPSRQVGFPLPISDYRRCPLCHPAHGHGPCRAPRGSCQQALGLTARCWWLACGHRAAQPRASAGPGDPHPAVSPPLWPATGRTDAIKHRVPATVTSMGARLARSLFFCSLKAKPSRNPATGRRSQQGAVHGVYLWMRRSPASLGGSPASKLVPDGQIELSALPAKLRSSFFTKQTDLNYGHLTRTEHHDQKKKK